jgi:hypothetical protein
MILKKVLPVMTNFILSIITIFIVVLSLWQKSLISDTTPYVEALGLIFVLFYSVLQRQTSGETEFANLYNQTKEILTQISNSEMERNIFEAVIKSGKVLMIFGLTNLILTLINIIVYQRPSWGNIIFSGLLIWPLIGKFQIRQELINSIYSGQKVRHILHKDSIELFTDNIHQKIMVKDLNLFYKTSKWLIFKRKKYADYIILDYKHQPPIYISTKIKA